MNIISIVGISATVLYTLYSASQAFLRVALTNLKCFVGSSALPLFGAADGMRQTQTSFTADSKMARVLFMTFAMSTAS